MFNVPGKLKHVNSPSTTGKMSIEKLKKLKQKLLSSSQIKSTFLNKRRKEKYKGKPVLRVHSGLSTQECFKETEDKEDEQVWKVQVVRDQKALENQEKKS